MEPSVIDELCEVEWELFVQVRNVGGVAPCQEDKVTFFVMRQSMYEAWSDEMIVSYKQDLQKAKQERRNLLVEKYAYMMESTNPTEFEEMKEILPVVSQTAKVLVRDILQVSVQWFLETQKQYPRLVGQGRVAESYYDTSEETSYETYLRGELYTYSVATLSAYVRHIRTLQAENRNMYLMILQNTIEKYGYQTLEEAEQDTLVKK